MKAYKFNFRNAAAPISVERYREKARRSLPKMIWAYVDGGADDLVSLHENIAAFSRYRLLPRVLTGVAKPDLATTIAGTKVSMPIGLAPTGNAGLSHWSGDVASTRAAEAAGTRAVLSSACCYTLEEVADATEQDHWFQLYPFADRDHVGMLIDRVQAAGYTALFVTVDVPVVGNRQGERETGMGVPLALTPARCLDFASHPRWLAGQLVHKRTVPVHYAEWAAKGAGPLPRSGEIAATAVMHQLRMMQGDLNWSDLAWMRERWKGKLFVKGVMNADDAAYAVDTIGAEGVVISNHGGRQLDRVQGTLDALPAIAKRIGDRAEVFLDGGVRRGTDVITALCLGANAVFIGRPYLYGLAVDGQAGVEAILRIFREELTRAMIMLGCNSVADLDYRWITATRD
jgi:L-lactate dehydrogenase (cytochrome)/(S)-mandelate dehydrogenase